MARFASFVDGIDDDVDTLVITLVDSNADPGMINRLVDVAMRGLDEKAAVRFDVDPLIDYRSTRPMLNFRNGRIVGMGREDLIVSVAHDVTGTPFLRLHGSEPDFHWDSLVSDILDIIDHFSITSVYSFTALGAPIPHTRPADMLVRNTNKSPNTVLDADFWFPASFSSYFEFHAGKLGIDVTNIAVRVPIYLAPHPYPAGAISALNLASSFSQLAFPVGDLTRDAEAQNNELATMMETNEELSHIIRAFEADYDFGNSAVGFVRAPEPELTVPTAEEIGQAAERFLEQAERSQKGPVPSFSSSFDPQGLFSRIEKHREATANNKNETNGEESNDTTEETQRPRRKGKHAY